MINTVYAEATEATEVVLFVDQAGVPVSTMTEGMLEYPPSTWTSSPPTNLLPPSSTNQAPGFSTATSTNVAATAPAGYNAQIVNNSPVTPATTGTAIPEAPSASSSSGSSGYGISYSPYNADGSCKVQSQVNDDFDSLVTGYSMVRIYGTDCNQTATVLTAARARKMKLFAGIFDLSTLDSEIQLIIQAAAGDWSYIDTISIGNELVNSGTASADTVIAAINTARGFLTAANYTGKVVTVDTLIAAKKYPELCDESDYCAVNSHVCRFPHLPFGF